MDHGIDLQLGEALREVGCVGVDGDALSYGEIERTCCCLCLLEITAANEQTDVSVGDESLADTVTKKPVAA